jgi:hypothetical protein
LALVCRGADRVGDEADHIRHENAEDVDAAAG